jgi:hypothetical protein
MVCHRSNLGTKGKGGVVLSKGKHSPEDGKAMSLNVPKHMQQRLWRYDREGG